MRFGVRPAKVGLGHAARHPRGGTQEASQQPNRDIVAVPHRRLPVASRQSPCARRSLA
jgi:hypothetical protein